MHFISWRNLINFFLHFWHIGLSHVYCDTDKYIMVMPVQTYILNFGFKGIISGHGLIDLLFMMGSLLLKS